MFGELITEILNDEVDPANHLMFAVIVQELAQCYESICAKEQIQQEMTRSSQQFSDPNAISKVIQTDN